MLRIASLFLYFICTVWIISTGNTKVLLFPKNTVFQVCFGMQFTIGISVPVAKGNRGGISFTSGFQFNYALPWNLSQFEPAIILAREIGTFDLQDVYTSLEDLLDKHGWQGGGACLLRTICELAETPLVPQGTKTEHQPDILEEIIHLLLTPSEDLPEAVNSNHRSVNKLYQEAERLGRSGGDCIVTYPDCIESPLESFTEIVFP